MGQPCCEVAHLVQVLCQLLLRASDAQGRQHIIPAAVAPLSTCMTLSCLCMRQMLTSMQTWQPCQALPLLLSSQILRRSAADACMIQGCSRLH